MGVEPDVEHAGRVAEVPAGERADVVGRPGDGGEVPQLAGAVVDRASRRRARGRRRPRAIRATASAGETRSTTQPGIAGGGIGDVEVGGEGVGVGEHDAAAGPHPGCRDDRLVEVDRRRVGAHDLSRRGADERPDPVADAGGGAPPAGVVPAGDEVVAPLAVHDVGDGLGHARRAARRASCRRGRRPRPGGGSGRAGRWRRGRRRARGPARSALTTCEPTLPLPAVDPSGPERCAGVPSAAGGADGAGRVETARVAFAGGDWAAARAARWSASQAQTAPLASTDDLDLLGRSLLVARRHRGLPRGGRGGLPRPGGRRRRGSVRRPRPSSSPSAWATEGDVVIGQAWLNRARRLLRDLAPSPVHGYLRLPRRRPGVRGPGRPGAGRGGAPRVLPETWRGRFDDRVARGARPGCYRGHGRRCGADAPPRGSATSTRRSWPWSSASGAPRSGRATSTAP